MAYDVWDAISLWTHITHSIDSQYLCHFDLDAFPYCGSHLSQKVWSSKFIKSSPNQSSIAASRTSLQNQLRKWKLWKQEKKYLWLRILNCNTFNIQSISTLLVCWDMLRMLIINMWSYKFIELKKIECSLKRQFCWRIASLPCQIVAFLISCGLCCLRFDFLAYLLAFLSCGGTPNIIQIAWSNLPPKPLFPFGKDSERFHRHMRALLCLQYNVFFLPLGVSSCKSATFSIIIEIHVCWFFLLIYNI